LSSAWCTWAIEAAAVGSALKDRSVVNARGQLVDDHRADLAFGDGVDALLEAPQLGGDFR
jgi:hypothetical protein